MTLVAEKLEVKENELNLEEVKFGQALGAFSLTA